MLISINLAKICTNVPACQDGTLTDTNNDGTKQTAGVVPGNSNGHEIYNGGASLGNGGA